MTVKTAAQWLDVSPSLIYELCRLGRIRHTRHGKPGKRGTIRIEEAAMEECRQSCKRETEMTQLNQIG